MSDVPRNDVQKVNILDKVKIGGLIYDVKVVDELYKDGQELLGWIQPDKLSIRLEKAPRQIMEQVFIHEIIHGIDNEYNIDLSESQVDRIANGIYALIQDNDIFNGVTDCEAIRKEGTD